jgi:ABC-type multidrug transport system ATPase subunit
MRFFDDIEQPQKTQEISAEVLKQVVKGRASDPNTTGELVGPPPPNAPSISLGYSDDNTVRIKNPVVSGRHARLYRIGDAYILEDQGSTNGTWVEGERIRRTRVGPEDRFILGNYAVSVADLVGYFEQRVPEPVLLTDIVKIGRSPDCEICIDAPMISAFHASLTPLQGGSYRLEDLGSTNGTFVNSRENRIDSVTVDPDEVVFLGSYRLPLSRLQSLLTQVGAAHEIVIPTDKAVMIVGRDEACDIVLDTPQVSRQHAEIRRLDEGTYEIRDLGSINGTFVNGQRIKIAKVTSEDLISFANFRLRLDPTAGVARKDYHGDIMLQAERITVHVPDRKSPGGYKTILDEVSFTAYPTEFVGLMGPSGAGKTTLMLALNGYAPPVAGRSLINGYDLYANYNSFRGNIGYVPQDDIIYRELTVFESLYYTAKLRLPPDTTDEEITAKIEDILDKLEIKQTRDVIIGDALKKGISGGQRKRVNLAQELLTEPSLLFLDEPTSGLASEDAINVMNLLRRLADEGRTILLTIHQPSLEAYRKLDNVIYLYEGRLIYYGPAYPDSILYMNPDVTVGTPEGDLLLSDPGNALKPIAEEHRTAMDQPYPWKALEGVVERRCAEFLESKQYRDYVYDRAVAPEDDVNIAEGSKQKTERRGLVRQFGILTRRCYNIKGKDKVNTAILLLQAPIIGLVLWLVFSGQLGSYFDMLTRGPAALFLLVASAVWFGCSNSAREIVGELAIYRRERMVNLMIPSYVLSKVTVLGLLCAVQCGILLVIVYPALGYRGSFFLVYLLLLLSSMAGVGMGLVLSAVVRSSEAAVALVPLLLIPQIIIGGIIMPIHDLNAPMKVFASVMVARWGFEGVLHVEYADDDLRTVRDRCGIDVCPDPLAVLEPSEGEATIETAFGSLPDRSYFPSGEAENEDICNVLCTNARRGNEVTPLEVAFGLSITPADPMRLDYLNRYGVGTTGSQTSLATVFIALLVFNLLLFALVCSILRLKDIEVG